jgi:G:T/U-mismatch repair DNA glycosylase
MISSVSASAGVDSTVAAMTQPITEVVDPAELPEVAAYLEAKDRLDAFREEHAAVFQTLAILAERHNAALEAADKAVRERGVASGPFVPYAVQTRYDLDLLAQRVGRAKWLALGGRFEEHAALDRERLELLVADETIPEALAIEARSQTLVYRKLKKAVLP